MLLLDNVIDVRDYGTYRLARQEGPSILSHNHWNSGAFVLEADSLHAVFDAIGTHCPTPRGRCESSDQGDGSFHAFESYEQAWETFTRNPSSLRKFTENDQMLRSIESAGNDVSMDVTGDYLDVGAFLEGAPECFGNMQMGQSRGFVTILVNMCVSGETPHHTITQFSKRIIRLVDWLEANQLRTRVVGIRLNETMHFECTVKRYEDHLDLNDIAVLSNPDFHRRILFRGSEYAASHTSEWGGYGWATSHAFGDFSLHRLNERFPNEMVIFTEKIVTPFTSEVDRIYDQLERDIARHLEMFGPKSGVIAVTV